MRNFIIPALLIASLSGCASFKSNSSLNNFDDAYFSTADLDKKGSIYSRRNAVISRTAGDLASNTDRSTRSYGQSYSDRFRNFGNSPVTPTFTPAMAMTPAGTRLVMIPNNNPFMCMYSPYGYGYNPYMMYGYNPYGYYGYDPYFGYDPSWSYWNQYYSPFNQNYWGGNTATQSEAKRGKNTIIGGFF